MTIHKAMHQLGSAAGFALLEARSERLGNRTVNYIDRAMIAASARCRRALEEQYTIEG